MNGSLGSVGFNVIGHLSGNLGLGVTARQIAKLILSKDLPLAVLDLDPGGGRGGHDQSFDDYAVRSPENLSHPINLFVLPPPTINALVENPSYRPLLLRPDRLQSIFVMWEHTQVPRAWRPALQMTDVIVTASHFMHATFATRLDEVLTIPGTLPHQLPQVVPSRERFQLPPETVIFVTSFEPRSDPERKNPLAVVQAFRRAFSNGSPAMLVVKVNNPLVSGQPHPIVLRLRDECARDRRLRLIEEPFRYDEILALYAACDVFVSLHRSEGFGLGLFEAMALGKPVIATAWSGNMTFMNALNSCLVSYRLVPVKATAADYSKRLLGPAALWADPNLPDAAAWMSHLVAHPGLRAAIGLRAAMSAAAYQKEAERGIFLDELTILSEQLPCMPSFRAKKAHLPMWERQLRLGDRRRAFRARAELLFDRYVLWRVNRWRDKR
jgi:glycosyltransferase involved in cell wall biosynthesis